MASKQASVDRNPKPAAVGRPGDGQRSPRSAEAYMKVSRSLCFRLYARLVWVSGTLSAERLAEFHF